MDNALNASGDFIIQMLNKIDDLGVSTVKNIYQTLAGYLGPLFLSGLTLYVVWWGYQMLFGRASLTAGEFVWRFGRAFVCYTLIVSWAAYEPLIATPLLKGPSAMGAVVCEAAGGADCGSDTGSMGQGIRDIWAAAIAGAKTVYAMGGVTAPQFFITAVIIVIFAIIFCATGAVILIIGKMTMFILLAIGPIIICAALFNLTSTVVDGWIRTLAAYALLPILVYTVLGLMTSLLSDTITAMKNGDAVFSTVMAFCFMCLASTYLLKELVGLAAGIAGGAPRIDGAAMEGIGLVSLTRRKGIGLGLSGLGRTVRGLRHLRNARTATIMQGDPATISDGDAQATQVRAAARNSRK